MSDPLRLAIVKAVQTKLRGMTTGSYRYPIVGNDSVKIDPSFSLVTNALGDLPQYVVEPSDGGVRDWYPAMQIRDTMPGIITARMDVTDLSDPTARATIWEGIAADLETALSADVTLGGLVYDFKLLPPLPMVGVGSPVVLLVQPWEARYNRTYGQP